MLISRFFHRGAKVHMFLGSSGVDERGKIISLVGKKWPRKSRALGYFHGNITNDDDGMRKKRSLTYKITAITDTSSNIFTYDGRRK